MKLRALQQARWWLYSLFCPHEWRWSLKRPIRAGWMVWTCHKCGKFIETKEPPVSWEDNP